MSSKHKRQQRQHAKAVALRPFANPEEEDEEDRGPGAALADEEDDFMPQVTWNGVRPLMNMCI